MSKSYKKIPIDLGDRSYDIHIGQDLLKSIQDYVPLDMEGKTIFVLTDENVSHPHAGSVYETLKSSKPESVQLLALPAGEQTKSFESLKRVISWLLDHKVARDSVLFAVGGGVIGDLAGFAASITMRGISYVQVPTTLLAQVDSSVGGKTAINIEQGKNLVGTFYQPVSVICDTQTLSTLPRREVLAGYAEIAKYALINDRSFFDWLQKEGDKVCDVAHEQVSYAIENSCRKKADIVSQDEKEKGVRALLNLGHTFAHALEGAAGYDGRLLHGEAVAIGMVLAHKLSSKMGLCDEAESVLIEEHLANIGLPTKINMVFPRLESSIEELMSFMKSDKKIEKGKISYILSKGIGRAFITNEVKNDDVAEVLKQSIDGN